MKDQNPDGFKEKRQAVLQESLYKRGKMKEKSCQLQLVCGAETNVRQK